MRIPWLLSLSLLSLLFVSCKKSNDLISKKVWTVSGYMMDMDTKQPLAGGNILMSTKDGKSHLLFSNSKDYSTRTDKNGYYKLEIEPDAEVVRLDVLAGQDSLYSDWHGDIDADSMFLEHNGATHNIDLVRAGWLRVEFKNASPVNDKDWFNFGYSQYMVFMARPVFESYSNKPTPDGPVWWGTEIHGSRKFPVPGDRKTVVYWEVRKNGVSTRYSDSVHCPRDAVTSFYINY